MNFGEPNAERRAVPPPAEGANAAQCLETEATAREKVIGRKRVMFAIDFDYLR